jgi:EAL domain-containing protein (putative c-di-GMP-specific phosphodiesterase class I)
VDDFGTGFCSLSYLARLPVDTLKIDRSFVVRMRDAGYPRNIVAMIVSLAHTLGLRVVAEGVEDDEQVRLLRELGCDQIQGFYVSRPVPPEDVDAMLGPGASKSLQQKLAAA